MPKDKIRKLAVRGVVMAMAVVILSGCIDCAPQGDPRRPTYPTFCRN